MRVDEFTTYDGIGIAQLLQKGEVTPWELGQCVVEAIERVNPALNAVVEVFPDALDDLNARHFRGPFHGIPTLTKDLPIEAGRLAQFGSRLTEGFRAKEDAVYWQRLRKGGLTSVGRTTTSEFAIPAATETLLYGATRNPWDVACGVAGSSAGAAAAVAAGIVPFAQGSDGGGSIRNPASFCGVLGLKPSRGRVTGAPNANAPLLGLATGFMLTRSVRDTAVLLDLCHGPDAGDGYEIAAPSGPYSTLMHRMPTNLRIAFCKHAWSGAPIEKEVLAAAEATANMLRGFGHDVEEASPDFDYSGFLHAQKVIWAADAAADVPALAKLVGKPLDENAVGPSVYAVYRYGQTLNAAQLIEALAVYDQVTRQLGRFMQNYDLLLTPTSTIVPEPIGTYDPNRSGLDIDAVFADLEPKETFTALFNATGQPAMSLPLGRSSSGLPIGMQFVAAYGQEHLLLALARQFEEHLEDKSGIWGQGLPGVHASR